MNKLINVVTICGILIIMYGIQTFLVANNNIADEKPVSIDFQSNSLRTSKLIDSFCSGQINSEVTDDYCYPRWIEEDMEADNPGEKISFTTGEYRNNCFVNNDQMQDWNGANCGNSINKEGNTEAVVKDIIPKVKTSKIIQNGTKGREKKLMINCCVGKKNQIDKSKYNFVEMCFRLAEKQLSLSLKQNTDRTKFPRTIDEAGSLVTDPGESWVSGFYPGCLWFMYEFTGDRKWKREATNWTESLKEVQFDTTTHDVGFIITASYGQGYKLTNNTKYKDVIINAAKSLATRYNDRVGCTRSWSWGQNRWKFPVIIDNMMNLELLFVASNLSGDETYRNIAINHAKTTMNNHFRKDYSSFHLLDYDPESGEIIKKETFQGFSDNSSWSRGQGWGLYGFTYCYRETGDTTFLKFAKCIADFIIYNPNTPEDLIPVWDYDLYGVIGEPRDASAASLIASGLLELSKFAGEDSTRYFNYAEKLLVNLSSDEYLAQPSTNGNFILMHSTGNKPEKSEIDVPIIYADYYFLEALLRYRKMKSPQSDG